MVKSLLLVAHTGLFALHFHGQWFEGERLNLHKPYYFSQPAAGSCPVVSPCWLLQKSCPERGAAVGKRRVPVSVGAQSLQKLLQDLLDCNG